MHIDPVDGSIIEVGVIHRSQVLQDDLISLPAQLALHPGDVRTGDAQLALRPATHANGVVGELVRLPNAGAGEHLNV